MDQRPALFAPIGQREAKPDGLADTAQLQKSLDELRKTIQRLHEMQPAYLELIETAQANIQDSHEIGHELNRFAMRLGISPIPRSRMVRIR